MWQSISLMQKLSKLMCIHKTLPYWSRKYVLQINSYRQGTIAITGRAHCQRQVAFLSIMFTFRMSIKQTLRVSLHHVMWMMMIIEQYVRDLAQLQYADNGGMITLQDLILMCRICQSLVRYIMFE